MFFFILTGGQTLEVEGNTAVAWADQTTGQDINREKKKETQIKKKKRREKATRSTEILKI